MPIGIDEYERYMFKSKQYVMDRTSDYTSFIVALTMKCNLRCVYCFEEGRYDDVGTSSETLENIYNYIVRTITENKKRD